MRAPSGAWMFLLVALAAVAAPPALAQEAERADMEIVLADPAVGGAAGRSAGLDVTVTADLMVEEDDEGVLVRLVLPHAHDSAVQLSPLDLEFFAPDSGATDGDYGVEEMEHNQTYAVFRWTRDAPEVGSVVATTLDATRTVDLADMLIVIWASHGFDNVTVRVDLPSTHDLVGTQLTRQAHNVAAGRSVWTGSSTDPSLSATIRPNTPITDDAFETYRPSSVTAWLIIAGLAIVSGGAWVIGKRLEKEDEDNAGPDGPGGRS